MVETAAAPTSSSLSPLASLIKSPEFLDLPADERIREIDKAAKQDTKFRNHDGATRHAIVMRLLQAGGREAEPGDVPATIGNPSPLQAAGQFGSQVLGGIKDFLVPKSMQGTPAPQGDVPVQTLGTPQDDAGVNINALVPSAMNQVLTDAPAALRLPGRAAVRALDAPVTLAATALDAVSAPGRMLTSTLGVDASGPLPRAISNPGETALAGKEGFSPEATPGLRALQHILDSTMQGAVGGVALGKIFHTAAQGIPLTQVALREAYLGMQGAGLGEAAKSQGAGPWAQLAVELVGGGMSINDVRKVFGIIASRPRLQTFIVDTAKKQPNVEANIAESKEAQDLLGADFRPSLAEQTGDPLIATGQRELVGTHPDTYGRSATTIEQQNLKTMTDKVSETTGAPEDALLNQTFSDAAAPVRQAETALSTASGNKQTLLATQRNLTAQHTTDLRASQDLATTQINDIQAKTDALKDNLLKANRDAEDAVRASQDVGNQVSAANRTKLRQAEDDAQVRVRAAQEALQGAQDEKTTVLRAHQNTINTAVVNARGANKTAAVELKNQQEALNKISVQNQQDLATVQDYTTKSVKRVSPEMASTPGTKQGEVGQAITERGGKAVQDLEGAAWKRTQDEAKVQYGGVYKKYGVEGDAGPLNRALESFEDEMSATVRESYISDPAMNDIRQTITERQKTQVAEAGGTLNLSKTPSGHAQRDATQLTLEDVHDMRSRVLTELRATNADSPRRTVLVKLAGVLDAQTQLLAKNFPGAYDELMDVNKWYRGEMKRFNSGPGDYSTRIDPRTGEKALAPDVVANMTFSAGPTLDRTAKQLSDNAQNFKRYLQDIDNDLQEAAMTGNLPLMFQAQSAQDAVFDVAKAQFYAAAVDEFSGVLNPKAAEKWLREHDTLIKSSDELTKVFRTPQDRLAAIRDVQAKAQGDLARGEANVQTAQTSLGQTKEAGGDAVFQARQDAIPGQRQAQDDLTAAQRMERGETQAASDELTQVRRTTEDDQLIADEATRQLQGQAQQIARDTADRSTQVGRTAKQWTQDVKRDVTLVKRSQADEQVALDNRIRLATEAENSAKTAASGAKTAFNDVYGSSTTTRMALNDQAAAEALGSPGRSLVANIEAKTDLKDKNLAYVQLFKTIGNNQPAKDAILAAQWQDFLAKRGQNPATNLPGQPMIPNAEDLAGFLKEKKDFLARYFPTYEKDLNTIQKAAESADRASKAQGSRADIPRQMRETTSRVRGFFDIGAIIAARSLGIPYSIATGVGLGVEGLSRWNNASKAALLHEVYFNPQSTNIVAHILNPKADPTWKRVMFNNIAQRALPKTNALSNVADDRYDQ